MTWYSTQVFSVKFSLTNLSTGSELSEASGIWPSLRANPGATPVWTGGHGGEGDLFSNNPLALSVGTWTICCRYIYLSSLPPPPLQAPQLRYWKCVIVVISFDEYNSVNLK